MPWASEGKARLGRGSCRWSWLGMLDRSPTPPGASWPGGTPSGHLLFPCYEVSSPNPASPWHPACRPQMLTKSGLGLGSTGAAGEWGGVACVLRITHGIWGEECVHRECLVSSNTWPQLLP